MTHRPLPPWTPPARRMLRLGLGALACSLLGPELAAAQTCARTLTADVVALDQPLFYNRLGAHEPEGMIFALRDDVVALDGTAMPSAGNARLRDGKRPRPLTLRVNVGDCLRINFTNLLDPIARSNQPGTRAASVHVVGMFLVDGIASDGSHVGQNPSSLVEPGQTASYTLQGAREGTYLMHSAGQLTGGDGDGGHITKGLFGAVNVEPKGAEWYRSQLTQQDLAYATTGYTPAGHPIVDYTARYPAGHPLAGRPILAMLDGTRIVHGDLNAIITGPNRGRFPAGTYRTVAVEPDRDEPFREFTIIFHDEAGLRQAFDHIFEDPKFEHTLHSGRDAFPINYGSGGVGAEVLSNRLGVGPAADCADCKFEESFLSSWVFGDPAMVVDVPADFDGNLDGQPDTGAKATKAFYPDDPSNVFHSYLNDRVKIRNLHAGPKEHHIFHLHAHQWLNTPESDNSTYLDSKAIGPGAGFTYEIAHGGSGNRNKTPGDAILHCHFYPHFAQGMWGIWRVHDVFEGGTQLDVDGRPAPGARALPDGEIASGTPIPAVVPMPGKALAPMPTEAFPGYPFYIPGKAGHRPPRPPMDVAIGSDGKPIDGGLPRHVPLGGTAEAPALNTRDFSKKTLTLAAEELPEGGTALEQNAITHHANPSGHGTFALDGAGSYTTGTWRVNGSGAVAGAPFADPCRAYSSRDQMKTRVYKSASFQIDAKYNKAGWHFPQHRMYALWEDVASILDGSKAPEPFIMRTNTYDCIQFHQVNLLPMEYQMDDFQVRTPTDILGQHIHLVKFDVLASDGGANGWNYEDGSLAPGEVRERIHAIRKHNACVGTDSGDPRDGTFTCPVAKAHPYFGAGPDGRWIGAMETVQRWYADDVLNAGGEDRTLRSIFTHDHYAPSTQQQGGLYAALLGEPQGSTWRDPETGATFGTRADGGPTSWRADIITADPANSYREFTMMINDFAMAYEAEATTFPDPLRAINPPGKFEVGLPHLVRAPVHKGICPNGIDVPPCPELIAADDPGTITVNYRNEPLALRVRDPGTNTQAAGLAGDLSHAFRSDVTRADTRLNTYGPYTQRPAVGPNDPFTPLMRAKEGDNVQIRMLVGAHEEGHNLSIDNPIWRFEPSDLNSGWRNNQMMGVSEHYEFQLPPLPKNNIGPDMDFLYRMGAATDNVWNGTWGLMRVSQRGNTGLYSLPNNSGGNFVAKGQSNYDGVCLKTSPTRSYDVTAVLARDVLPEGALVYNSRGGNGGALNDPTAIMYVRTSDLDAYGKLKAGVPVEPLILRANAGDCIYVTLNNRLPADMPDLPGYNTLPPIVDQFNANSVKPSNHVGLHAQLVSYDVTRGQGSNVGNNPVQTVGPGQSKTYQWYAGLTALKAGTDSLTSTPVEFGAVNLVPADPIKHASKGAIGALVIEPQGSTWTESTTSRAAADVKPCSRCVAFREFVLMFQNDLNLRFGEAFTGTPFVDDETGATVTPSFAAGDPIPNLADADDPEDSGQKALNYRTEPMWKRMGFAPNTPLEVTRDFDFRNAFSNQQVGGDPLTPVFTAKAGQQVRFRVLQPGGHARNGVFHIHGHAWEELPYTHASAKLGSNAVSETKGSRDGHGPLDHFDVLIPSAGGPFKVTGDYLFGDKASFGLDGGLWGILRVTP